MSLAAILEELPAFSIAERQLLVRRVIELDEPSLSNEHEQIIRSRLADHDESPATAMSLEAIKVAIFSAPRK